MATTQVAQNITEILLTNVATTQVAQNVLELLISVADIPSSKNGRVIFIV